MAMRCVLLVHADPVVQELATRALGHIGVDVKIAPEPAAATEHLNSRSYPVVVIDHAGMDRTYGTYPRQLAWRDPNSLPLAL